MKRLLGLVMLLCWLPGFAAAQVIYDPPGYQPYRRALPSGLDFLESGLYWMQDYTGAENPYDPASLIELIEDQMARYFDFADIAFRVAGPRYAAKNILARSHFQNRVRDRLFEILARDMGWLGDRMPRVRPLWPRRTGVDTLMMGAYFAHFHGPLIRLEFHMYFSHRGWRVFDVRQNGRSVIEQLRYRFLLGKL